MKAQAMLANKRKQIEKIDNDIVQLLIQRAKLSIEIGAIKREHGLAIYCASQEEKIIAQVLKKGGEVLPPQFLEAIFREIFSVSRNLQKPFNIVTLGPRASFSYLASKRHFGKSASLSLVSDIRMVFEEVERGEADVGVVPAENSLEGVVNATMDAFVETSLNILGEYYLKITHSLLSQSQKLAISRISVRTRKALAQCRNWIRANLPQAVIVETESTSQAALIATKEPHYGAIANELAAELYSLNKIATAIEDSTQNTTRFFIIGKQKSAPTGNDKTSLVLGALHIPGALRNILEPFATRNINLTRLESRPIKTRLWEYLFFIDFEGHIDHEEVAECLKELASNVSFLKVLGSYPRRGGG